MGNEIKSVNNAQASQQAQSKTKCSETKRMAYILSPLPSSVFTFTKELIDGKNIYEAGNKVKKDYEEVGQATRENFKENVKKTNETISKVPFCGVLGYMFKTLNAMVN